MNQRKLKKLSWLELGLLATCVLAFESVPQLARAQEGTQAAPQPRPANLHKGSHRPLRRRATTPAPAAAEQVCADGDTCLPEPFDPNKTSIRVNCGPGTHAGPVRPIRNCRTREQTPGICYHCFNVH